MNRGLLHEIRRTALVRLAVVLGLALLVTGAASTLAGPSPVSDPSIATVYYYGDGAYHLVAFVYDANGHPLAGLPVTFDSPNGLPPGSTTDGTTSASGVVAGTFPSLKGNFTYSVTASTSSGSATVSTELTNWPYDPPNGTVVDGFGDLVPVRAGVYAPMGGLMAFFAGPNGTPPSGYRLQYQYATFDLQFSGLTPPAGTRSPDHFSVPPGWVNRFPLANLTTFSAVAVFQVPPAPNGFGPAILAQIVAPNGTVVADAILPPTDFGPQPTSTPATQAVELVLTEVGLVALVAGILGGLALYGNDRLSGALEPYLARPVTARGFLAARYVGLLVTLLVGTVGGLLLADAALAARYGAGMPGPLLAVALAASAAVVAAWLAVPFALAHLARTPIRLLTAALGIVVAFGFLWTPALTAVGPWVGAGPGTSGASVLNFDGQMADPVLAPSTLVAPALVGVGSATVIGIVVTLALWIIVPIAWALRGASRGE